MKRFFSLLIVICFITNISFGATLKIIERDFSYNITKSHGSKVYLETKGNDIIGWTVTSENVSLDSNNSFTLPEENVEIEAEYGIEEYTIRYDILGGKNQPETQTKITGETIKLTTVIPEKKGYTFSGWSTNSNATTVNYLSGADYSLDQDMIFYAVYKAVITMPANTPIITENLTPLNYDEGTSTWVNAELENWIYDYDMTDGETKWANAKNKLDGKQYVWIPRFSYYIDEGDMISWNAETPGTARTHILFSNGKTDYTKDPTGSTDYNYTPHPGFTMKDTVNSKTYELSGIWVEKYESENSDTFNNAFTTSLAANSEFDTHLIKGWEWIAVAGLTSAIGKIPTNTEGVEGSTTHNVYGIYDTANDNSEFIADCGGENYSNGYNAIDITNILKSIESYGEKYTSSDAFMNTQSIYAERENISWDNGGASCVGSPVMTRGANNIFSYNCVGTSSSAYYRKVLTPESRDSSTITYTVIYDANGGSFYENAKDTIVQKKKAGNSVVINYIPVRHGYLFIGWSEDLAAITTGYDIIASKSYLKNYHNGDLYSDDANITLYAVWLEDTDFNKPVLGEGMIPVNWDPASGKWVDTDVYSWDYNYTMASKWESSVGSDKYGNEGDGTARWANARTSDGLMWVWIPRFTYLVEEGNKISWNADESWVNNGTETNINLVKIEETGTAKTYIKFSDGLFDHTDGLYTSHSAFGSFITGFWVGKYEGAFDSAGRFDIGDTISWTGTYGNPEYKSAKNYNSYLKSHMIMNREWGAITYLTSAIGRIPYLAAHHDAAASSQKYSINYEPENQKDPTYVYNLDTNVKASTTHNIYGIYGMSGYGEEFVAAHVEGKEYLSEATSYVDMYQDTTPRADDAILGWDAAIRIDLSEHSMVDGDIPITRGGNRYSQTGNIFEVCYANGDMVTTRLVLHVY